MEEQILCIEVRFIDRQRRFRSIIPSSASVNAVVLKIGSSEFQRKCWYALNWCSQTVQCTTIITYRLLRYSYMQLQMQRSNEVWRRAMKNFKGEFYDLFNRLTPNDPYVGRTATLTSKRCILYIYSTNIRTEYFKHALYSPFFFLFKMQFVS